MDMIPSFQCLQSSQYRSTVRGEEGFNEEQHKKNGRTMERTEKRGRFGGKMRSKRRSGWMLNPRVRS